MNQLIEEKRRFIPGELAGKYLTFLLAGRSYGITVKLIREIIPMLDITTVPQMPEHIRGVVNLRGKIIPVVDLRLRLGTAVAETDARTCIVVVQLPRRAGAVLQAGLVVDGVEEVLNVHADDLEEPPRFGTAIQGAYLLGMAKIKEEVKALLDIEQVLGDEVPESLPETAAGV